MGNPMSKPRHKKWGCIKLPLVLLSAVSFDEPIGERNLGIVSTPIDYTLKGDFLFRN
jgi:hypothetical protein